MLTEATAELLDPLYWAPEGECHELPDGKFAVRGKFRSFIVSSPEGSCQCGRTGSCRHREALKEYLAGNTRSCPICHGNGIRRLGREGLTAVINGNPVESFICSACSGEGVVSVRRRAALMAGLKKRRAA